MNVPYILRVIAYSYCIKNVMIDLFITIAIINNKLTRDTKLKSFK